MDRTDEMMGLVEGRTEEELLEVIATLFGLMAEEAQDEALTVVNDRLNSEGDEQYDFDDSMDGDHASALASAGFGTDEDYGYYGGDDY
jgi:hypothetical protein